MVTSKTHRYFLKCTWFQSKNEFKKIKPFYFNFFVDKNKINKDYLNRMNKPIIMNTDI